MVWMGKALSAMLGAVLVGVAMVVLREPSPVAR